MNKYIYKTLAIGFLLVFSSCAGRSLYSPQPINFDKIESQKIIRNQVKEVLHNRNWTITKDWAEFLEATYDNNRYAATIRIHIDRRQVRIRYMHSKNLRYKFENGERSINKTYNKLVKVIERDLLKVFQINERRTNKLDNDIKEMNQNTQTYTQEREPQYNNVERVIVEDNYIEEVIEETPDLSDSRYLNNKEVTQPVSNEVNRDRFY